MQKEKKKKRRRKKKKNKRKERINKSSYSIYSNAQILSKSKSLTVFMLSDRRRGMLEKRKKYNQVFAFKEKDMTSRVALYTAVLNDLIW